MSNAWRIVLIKRYSPNLQCHTIGCLIVLFGLRTDSEMLQLFAFIFHFLLSIILADFTLLVQMLTRFMINYCSFFLLIPPKKTAKIKLVKRFRFVATVRCSFVPTMKKNFKRQNQLLLFSCFNRTDKKIGALAFQM